jgi:hypothetical protein
VHLEETDPWAEGGEMWRVLRAFFPGSIETHSMIQEFFFGEDLMLRRHDYRVNIAGGFPASQLTSQYVVADGIHLPTKRRAYTRGPDRRPILDMLMVSIDLSDVRFEAPGQRPLSVGAMKLTASTAPTNGPDWLVCSRPRGRGHSSRGDKPDVPTDEITKWQREPRSGPVW